MKRYSIPVGPVKFRHGKDTFVVENVFVNTGKKGSIIEITCANLDNKIFFEGSIKSLKNLFSELFSAIIEEEDIFVEIEDETPPSPEPER
jgi:hypothetical protein